jgi:hypothetical protein
LSIVSIKDICFNLKWICGFLIFFKIAYLGCVAVSLLIWPGQDMNDLYYITALRFSQTTHFSFADHFSACDGAFYLHLATQGYQEGDYCCAFYPLFPWLIRAFSILTDGNMLISGMILSNVFSLGGELLLFALIKKRFGEKVAWLSLFLIIIFPGSLYFQFIYTEGLFFFVLLLLVYSIEEERLSVACIAAILLPLTKAVGVFSIFPIVFYLFFQSETSWMPDWLSGTRLSRRCIDILAARRASQTALMVTNQNYLRTKRHCLLLAPLCGFAVYLLYMSACTGNPFEGFYAQKRFECETIGNIFNLPKFIDSLFTLNGHQDPFESILSRCSFIMLLSCLPIIWRLDKGWFLWAVFLGVVPAMSGMFVSYTRFASVVFPLYIALATFLNKPGLISRCLLGVIICTFAVVHAIILWKYVNFRWAG